MRNRRFSLHIKCCKYLGARNGHFAMLSANKCNAGTWLFVIQPLIIGKFDTITANGQDRTKTNVFNILNTLHSFSVRCSSSPFCTASPFRSHHAHFCNLDKLNRNDNKMNNGEVKRTREYIARVWHTVCVCVQDMRGANSSRGINTRNLFIKKLLDKTKNAYKRGRKKSEPIGQHIDLRFSFVKMRGTFCLCSKNLFGFSLQRLKKKFSL